jgi:hypothetical protein
MTDNIFTQGYLDFKDNITEVNYDLFKYGIFEEKSDIRAHVTHEKVYVFKTKILKELLLLKGNELPDAKAYQSDYDEPTGYGKLIKPEMIYDMRILQFTSWNEWINYKKEWSTTLKGKWAVKCVVELIRIGRFPFWLEVTQNEDVKIDIQGTDILVVMNQRIQVKCDYPIFKTGNLFIQTHEKNPFKMY